jgi:hypothetical protein
LLLLFAVAAVVVVVVLVVSPGQGIATAREGVYLCVLCACVRVCVRMHSRVELSHCCLLRALAGTTNSPSRARSRRRGDE